MISLHCIWFQFLDSQSGLVNQKAFCRHFVPRAAQVLAIASCAEAFQAIAVFRPQNQTNVGLNFIFVVRPWEGC